MPNTKTSDEIDGAPVQSGDQFRIARAGSNFRVSSDDINTFVQSFVPGPVTPAGSDGDIQYNLTGAFAANTKFNWDTTTNSLRLGEPAGSAKIYAFDGINGTVDGCSLTISSGAAFNSGAAKSGDFTLTIPNGLNSGAAGQFSILGGASAGGTATAVNITAGSQTGAGSPGSVNITAGDQIGTGVGASVNLNATLGSSGSRNGSVNCNTGLSYVPSSNTINYVPPGTNISILPNSGLWKSTRVYPGSGTTVLSHGVTGVTTVGTVAHPIITGTNFATRNPSYTALSGGAPGAGAGSRGTLASYHRNTGIRFDAVFNNSVNTTGFQFFAGLYNAATALAGNPSALTNMIGMGYDAADLNSGNWQLMHNDNVGTATRIDLGASFARNTTSALRLVLNLYPSTTAVDYSVQDLVTGASTSGTLTSDLPVSNTSMNWMINGYNGAVVAACQPRIWYASIDGPMS